jgi:hypothetical protein
MEHSYIIRFPTEEARNQFGCALEESPVLSRDDVEFGEFLPDVVVRGISDTKLEELKRIADPEARFFEDFKHDFFARR